MNRYAQGGDLTQFNEGGLHSQNPLGGIPIGNNNLVEEGETKQNNFVYSNRVYLNENVVSQYNLPKSLIGKSVADATKYIDDKFKGRNDKISNSTKTNMLDRIANAQEDIKAKQEALYNNMNTNANQAPEDMMNGQIPQGMESFADGGELLNDGSQGSQIAGDLTTTAANMFVPGLGNMMNYKYCR
jgi:hypothetical protein